ncbi:MAG: tRNA preQ1(34) S-adenosylmethionine ribosyltransferase-isomerase QueA [Candidatus Andersenbacteria bacterium]|nr:tRNA preQ1(34) S-adenosylmethionine ribosyltransferase-isomerase QueA [Candidatus Andersenbacteria bacterium]
MQRETFDYTLPPELIAHAPAQERDASRLFIYDTASNTVSFDTFEHLANYVPADSLLVLNDTKVVPARLEVKKETGGKVELLLLVNEWREGEAAVQSLSDRKITVGQKLLLSDRFSFEVVGQQENIFLLKPGVPIPDLFLLLEEYGTTPVPRYLEPVPLSQESVKARYQSMFASRPASVAAPTASLHFTPRVFNSLEKKGISKAYVTLHVGLGTFAPVTDKHMQEGKLHREFAVILPSEADSINKRFQEGKKLLAVGTTAARVLETRMGDAGLIPGEGFTDIFITPGYTFKAIDGLITNFHLPQSSLMMLVQALLTHKRAKQSLKELYEIAIREKFRFYSFGDAMLIK